MTAWHDKALNDALALLDRTYLSPETLALPSKYFLSISLGCDIQCPFCPRQYYSRSQTGRGMMRISQASVLEPYFKYANYTGLFGLGEPFLNPDFMAFVEMVKNAGGYAATSTHGMSLTPEVVERLMELEMDEVAVSMDAPNRRLFEFLRRGARFDTVVGNLQHLLSRKITQKRRKPAVHLAVTLSRHNVRQAPAIVRLAKDLGAERVVFTDMIVVDPNNKNLSVAGTELMTTFMNKARRQAKKLGQEMIYFPQAPFPWAEQDSETNSPTSIPVPGVIPIECDPPVAEVRKGHFGCPELWGSFNVERDGQVKTCCYIDTDLGNVFHQPLESIENSLGKGRLREALTQGQLPRPCRACPNLVEATAEYVANQLNAVSAALAKSGLQPEARERVERHLAEYRRIFARREGFGGGE